MNPHAAILLANPPMTFFTILVTITTILAFFMPFSRNNAISILEKPLTNAKKSLTRAMVIGFFSSVFGFTAQILYAISISLWQMVLGLNIVFVLGIIMSVYYVIITVQNLINFAHMSWVSRS